MLVHCANHYEISCSVVSTVYYVQDERFQFQIVHNVVLNSGTLALNSVCRVKLTFTQSSCVSCDMYSSQYVTHLAYQMRYQC